MREARDHSRQPECSATTPPVIGVKETRRKPAASIIAANCLRLGKFADQLDQILIGLAVAGHRLADRRDDVERIQFVERVEARHVDRGKFQAKEPPAGPQHAEAFRQRRVDARHVADAERDRHGIEALVGKRQRLGIALLELDRVVAAALGDALAADRQHLVVDVADGRPRAGAAGFDDPQRDVAGAAGQIEQGERPARISAD